MSNTIIKVENLSKQYRLGQVGTGTIGHDLNRWWHTVRGKEDPYLKLGEENDRTKSSSDEYVWALQDINFEISKGEVMGVIGRNGAGKSTLLKILSNVTQPTTGSIRLKGRIASLLEVGTGFHPELTGRENVFLNGAILGMTKNEIKSKFDEIVDFAGVERYIDTPVKRYSSGMYVRLAFGVAAHLEPEILIVDEVLAVGDAEFQKKALGKMKDVSTNDGRTVLFVSHNLSAIETLCDKGIVLNKGKMHFAGPVSETILSYLNLNNTSKAASYAGDGIIKEAKIFNEDNIITYNSPVQISVRFDSKVKIKNLVLGIVIKDIFDSAIIAINNKHYIDTKLHDEEVDKGIISVQFPNLNLLPGNYSINLFLGDSATDIEKVENAIFFTVEDSSFTKTANALDYRLNKTFIETVYWDYKK